jgi:hypothetical protein
VKIEVFECDTCGALAKPRFEEKITGRRSAYDLGVSTVAVAPKVWRTAVQPEGRPAVHTCRDCLKQELDLSQHEILVALARGEVRRRRKVAKLPPQPTTTQNPNGTETHDEENDDAGKDGRVKLLAASLRATASRLLRSQLLREQFQRFPELRAEVADLAAFADALAEEVGLPVAGGTIEALAGGVS